MNAAFDFVDALVWGWGGEGGGSMMIILMRDDAMEQNDGH